jgi:primosomal protein N'
MKRVSTATVGSRVHFEFRDGQRVFGLVTSITPAREGDAGYLVTWRTRSGLTRTFNPADTYNAHAFYAAAR